MRPEDDPSANPVPGLRPDDFRDQWAHQLVRLQLDTKQLAGDVREQKEQLRNAAAELRKMLPAVVAEAKAKLDEGAGSLERSREALQLQQGEFLAELRSAKQAIESARKDLDERRGAFAHDKTKLQAERVAFAGEVASFHRLTVWERIFVPSSLKAIVKKYSRTAT